MSPEWFTYTNPLRRGGPPCPPAQVNLLRQTLADHAKDVNIPLGRRRVRSAIFERWDPDPLTERREDCIIHVFVARAALQLDRESSVVFTLDLANDGSIAAYVSRYSFMQ